MNLSLTRTAPRLRNSKAEVSDIYAPTNFAGIIECIREFTP